ncbi:hypothetical protein ILUMI_16930 [Ignelater luminosus]|uniref:Clip domain-containing protein n=1 Tax=Ignelater luminosus TaxID=2038154 RepID=A0A8K0G8F1_IGNLU|nr:hypothetical protein ILUMI_16930 [Ignelater luminosus]
MLLVDQLDTKLFFNLRFYTSLLHVCSYGVHFEEDNRLLPTLCGDPTLCNEQETCEAITECAVGRRSLEITRTHNLKRCGFEGKIEKVCCPTDETKTREPIITRISEKG